MDSKGKCTSVGDMVHLLYGCSDCLHDSVEFVIELRISFFILAMNLSRFVLGGYSSTTGVRKFVARVD